MTRALIIFVRPPELGRVKTRLARTIGDEAALAIYERLLHHTRTTAEHVVARRYLFYAARTLPDDDWKAGIFDKRLQASGDLGKRMTAAFAEVFAEGCRSAVIIGSDCPQLTGERITQALHELDQQDLVIGPAADGGYYLLGMNRLHTRLFENKAWSTASVCKDTLADAGELGLTTAILPVLSDVDDAADLPAMAHLL